MTAQIIQAADAFRSRAAAATLIEGLADARLSDTARNNRLRAERKEAWTRTEAKMRFYKGLADFLHVLSIARRERVPDALRMDHSEERFREARMAERDAWQDLLFLPAPDQAALKWKIDQLRKGSLSQVREAELEAMIAEDQAFLAAHPIRKPGSRKPGPKPKRGG